MTPPAPDADSPAAGARRRRWRQLWAAIVIGVVSTLAAYVTSITPVLDRAFLTFDDAAYDAAYSQRTPQARTQVPITLIEIDGASLASVAAHMGQGWPWPREGWALVIDYLQQRGAKVIVFDLLFNQPSPRAVDDDEAFARAIDSANVPIVFASDIHARFAPPVKRPVTLGATDITPAKVYRTYLPTTPGGASLAVAALHAAGVPTRLSESQPFALLYHGPHRGKSAEAVYQTVPASAVFFDATGSLSAEKRLPETLFRDRIVLIGATAAATLDLKSTPLDARYPGVAVHATAIDNLMNGDSVTSARPVTRFSVALLSAILVSAGAIGGRSMVGRLATPLLTTLALCLLSIQFMQRPAPVWIAPSVSLLAVVLASVGGLVWGIKVQDAHARRVLKILAQCVSPSVAATLSAAPQLLRTGGQQRHMTVLFSDLQGFTDLTERLGPQIEPVLNDYLARLSDCALSLDGTIDKFIGDAMMAFWNAPVNQTDHALRACRCAMAIVNHTQPGTAPTRVGIHTGPMVVGFFGSSKRLSYTAIGDAVNIAARIEPANKQYGTHILISADTYDAVRSEMLCRPIDRVRLYGKSQPTDLYELIAPLADATDAQKQLAQLTQRAVDAYRKADFTASREMWHSIQKLTLQDSVATIYLQRIQALLTHPREEVASQKWDAIADMTSK